MDLGPPSRMPRYSGLDQDSLLSESAREDAYWRELRHGTRADDEVARLDATARHFYAGSVKKADLAELDLDPAPLLPFRRLERVHGGDRLCGAPPHLRKSASGANAGV